PELPHHARRRALVEPAAQRPARAAHAARPRRPLARLPRDARLLLDGVLLRLRAALGAAGATGQGRGRDPVALRPALDRALAVEGRDGARVHVGQRLPAAARGQRAPPPDVPARPAARDARRRAPGQRLEDRRAREGLRGPAPAARGDCAASLNPVASRGGFAETLGRMLELHARRRSSGLAALVLLALIALASGCADIQTQRRDWSAYTGPGAEYFRVEEPPLPLGFRDPAQPFNRGLFAVNDWLVDWIVSPISVGWRFVFRPTVREHIAQFGTNLAFPTRALNQLAQGQAADAGRETVRFVINSTVGLLGFFDPASSWGLEAPRPEDTGQSLQRAGWADPA